jgi:hypothetical protein
MSTSHAPASEPHIECIAEQPIPHCFARHSAPAGQSPSARQATHLSVVLSQMGVIPPHAGTHVTVDPAL